MTNIVNIIKATGGKNLITSSHASDSRTHRTPYDVAALLISLGLDKNKALATLK
jgi:RNase P/RNase MRP subunit p30